MFDTGEESMLELEKIGNTVKFNELYSLVGF